MPLAPDSPFPKTQGDNIRSKDWNDIVMEVMRLDNDKTNRSGDHFTGPLTIDGSVGIGTSAPVEPLEVKGRIRAGQLSIGPWPADPNYVCFGTNTLDQAAAGNYALLQGSAGSDQGMTFLNSPRSIQFRIGNMDRMQLDGQGNLRVFGTLTSGKVGIGTDSPQAALDVNGAIRAGNSDIYFTQTDHVHTGAGNALGMAAIENSTSHGTLMILGRTVSTSPLNRSVSVWDQLMVHGALSVNGNLSVDGRISGLLDRLTSNNNAYKLILQDDRNLVIYDSAGNPVWSTKTNISDIKLKKGLKSIRGALEKVLSLRGVSFHWKDPALGEAQELGVIAQEVEKVFPELVSAIGGRKLVNYQGLVPVLIEAVRSQQARIEQLENKVWHLECR